MAITFVGAGATVYQTTSPITGLLPAGVAEDDLIIVFIYGRSGSFGTVSITGYTQRTDYQPDETTETWYKVAGASESDPSVSVDAGEVSGWSVQIGVWRGVDTTTPFDTADVTSTLTSVSEHAPTGLSTATDGAFAVSFEGSKNENALGLKSGSEQGFTARMSGTAYDHANLSVGVADKEIASASAVTFPTWECTVNAPVLRMQHIAMALRPSGAGGISIPSISNEGDVGASIQGSIIA